MRLPEGYRVRRPVPDDVGEVGAVMAAFDLADVGRVDFDQAWVAARWGRPGFRLERDAWVVTDPAGAIMAYLGAIELEDSLDSEGVVHPEHLGRGLGSALGELLEQRGREAPALRCVRAWIMSTDEAAEGLLRGRGFAPERAYVHMEVELGASALRDEPDVDGVALRPLRLDADELGTYRVLEEAFRDAWDWRREATTLERWTSELRSGDPLEPTATLVSEVGDDRRPVGVLIAGDLKGTGWVEWLAVHRGHQRRGVGATLLLRAFRAFRERGFTQVRVNVDADNETRAHVVYERVGTGRDA